AYRSELRRSRPKKHRSCGIVIGSLADVRDDTRPTFSEPHGESAALWMFPTMSLAKAMVASHSCHFAHDRNSRQVEIADTRSIAEKPLRGPIMLYIPIPPDQTEGVFPVRIQTVQILRTSVRNLLVRLTLPSRKARILRTFALLTFIQVRITPFALFPVSQESRDDEHCTPRFYADRTVGSDRDHRDSDCPAAACRPAGAGGGSKD